MASRRCGSPEDPEGLQPLAQPCRGWDPAARPLVALRAGWGQPCLLLSPPPGRGSAHQQEGAIHSLNCYSGSQISPKPSEAVRSGSPGTARPRSSSPETPPGSGGSCRSGQDEELEEGRDTRSFAGCGTEADWTFPSFVLLEQLRKLLACSFPRPQSRQPAGGEPESRAVAKRCPVLGRDAGKPGEDTPRAKPPGMCGAGGRAGGSPEHSSTPGAFPRRGGRCGEGREAGSQKKGDGATRPSWLPSASRHLIAKAAPGEVGAR